MKKQSKQALVYAIVILFLLPGLSFSRVYEKKYGSDGINLKQMQEQLKGIAAQAKDLAEHASSSKVGDTTQLSKSLARAERKLKRAEGIPPSPEEKLEELQWKYDIQLKQCSQKAIFNILQFNSIAMLESGKNENHSENMLKKHCPMDQLHDTLALISLYQAKEDMIDGVDETGNNIVHNAVELCNSNLLRLILIAPQNRALARAKNHYQNTPYQLAEKCPAPERQSIEDLFWKHNEL
ncbi:hypothetical protein EOPP23_02040 [Endozoicomonas sp. OPT23]|uniref:hypothetical protein n=1 Tax=Endozoicomonas sp. OPT23 TaxID=2072845 RepID=UPI00129B6445|nr:hypothetical protein [Endozoicomonas sp. OPT23]MRI31776.1 hypothetical protein [Endozoicomonas sp. OPT23]